MASEGTPALMILAFSVSVSHVVVMNTNLKSLTYRNLGSTHAKIISSSDPTQGWNKRGQRYLDKRSC